MRQDDPQIDPFQPADAPEVVEVLLDAFRPGDTYAVDRDIDGPSALSYWQGGGRRVWVARLRGQVVGTYYLVQNQSGGGDHVCNCGFVTRRAAEGRGVGRAMIAHALETARDAGFRAMQFNFVLASNIRAVETWRRAGFEIVGRLPGAFRHPEGGFVDALVMFRRL